MDDDFVEYVELLVQYIFSRNMLVTKKMNGRELKGVDLMMYMKVRCFLYFQLKLVLVFIFACLGFSVHSTFRKPLGKVELGDPFYDWLQLPIADPISVFKRSLVNKL